MELHENTKAEGDAALHADEGATAVEYGVMVALVIAVIIATIVLLGQDVLTALTDFVTEFVALTGP
jgi:pilus assembly protein Flp/PilA